MELWLKIVIIVVTLIVFLYLLGMLVTYTFYHIFKTKIRKRSKAISLLLVEKREIIIKIKDALIIDDIKIKKDLLKLINSFPNKIDINNLASEERNHLLHELNNTVNDLKKLAKGKYKELFDSIKEIDDSLRQNISIYNNNTLGYNYWIKVFWYRYLFKIAKKQPINKLD